MQHGVAILEAKRSGDPAQKEVDMAKSKKKKKSALGYIMLAVAG